MKTFPAILFCLLLQLCIATGSTAAEPTSEWKVLTETGLSAYGRKDLSAAERLLSKAVLKSETFPLTDPRRAYSISNLAVVFAAQGRREEAKPLFTRAIQLVDRSHRGAAALEIKIALRGLADNPFASQKFKSAERLYLSTQSKVR